MTQGKIMMKGMADIHSRFSDSKNNSHATSPIRDRPNKKEIYDRIIKNLDIFESFDADLNDDADASNNTDQ